MVLEDSMRVISGISRGCKLKSPEGLATRPTTDRIKESIFNIMAPDLYECRFLDIFSGSGAIAIEALSRGAKEAVLIDNSDKAMAVIKENLTHTKLIDKAETLKADVFAALNVLGAKGRQFDIIFLDPPYASGLYSQVLSAIVEHKLLDEDGYIIAEQSSGDEPAEVSGLINYRIKDYKTSKMAFYALEENDD